MNRPSLVIPALLTKISIWVSPSCSKIVATASSANKFAPIPLTAPISSAAFCADSTLEPEIITFAPALM